MEYLGGVEEFVSPRYGGAVSYLAGTDISIHSKGLLDIEENPHELFENIEFMRPQRISTIKTEADLVLDEIYKGITGKLISDDYIPEKEELISEEIQAFA